MSFSPQGKNLTLLCQILRGAQDDSKWKMSQNRASSSSLFCAPICRPDQANRALPELRPLLLAYSTVQVVSATKLVCAVPARFRPRSGLHGAQLRLATSYRATGYVPAILSGMPRLGMEADQTTSAIDGASAT
jgi:hypothetical protein